MTKPTLYIGSKVYSSWSLRPWLALRHGNIDFDEVIVGLFTDSEKANLAKLSPAGTVPVLEIDNKRIWDSLAISEWAAEHTPTLWPDDGVKRALARSVTATMHSAFPAMRQTYPHNIRRKNQVLRTPTPAAAHTDTHRLDAMLDGLLSHKDTDGPYLFGDWSIADGFYTPIAVRWRSYQFEISSLVEDYFNALLSEPVFQEWETAALAEDVEHEPYEVV